MNNKTHYIIARDGDTFSRIASTFALTEKTLRKYNEIDTKSTADPIEGEVIYIERKQTRWMGNVRKHTVRAGETLRSVAQDYAIQQKKLMRLNRMRKGSQLQVGQDIALK